jgi:hypothetical protein
MTGTKPAKSKSNKQRAHELKARRAKRLDMFEQRRRQEGYAFSSPGRPTGANAPVDTTLLAADNSAAVPEFVRRGYYLNQSFTCVDCKAEEIWTAQQQKWWYETAKGGIWTLARRCRLCRRQERARISEQRRVSAAGQQRKTELKAAGKWRTGL